MSYPLLSKINRLTMIDEYIQNVYDRYKADTSLYVCLRLSKKVNRVLVYQGHYGIANPKE